MATPFELTCQELISSPRTWLVTGAAGFIGSHLVQSLLSLDQRVIGLDNFATGSADNLEQVRQAAPRRRLSKLTFIEGDITCAADCHHACEGADFVLHQAGLGSVPRSLKDPLASHEANVTGFINMLIAVRGQRVRRLVYASSSSVYGDSAELPKVEDRTGHALSPYAATKQAIELYADVFARAYGIESIGLRYFNVFGPRQNPAGPYAAVIPLWISAMIENRPVAINGDGTTSRDFCYVANVVQANILAATCTNSVATNQVYNVALGARTTLSQLFELIRRGLVDTFPHLRSFVPEHRPARAGDIQHSLADISKAKELLGYAPGHPVEIGIQETLVAYAQDHHRKTVPSRQ